MAADAMVAAASDGIKESKMNKAKTVLISLSFGIFQTVMPVIGYFLGYSIKDHIIDYISWIAFSILFLLSLKSFYDGISEIVKRKKEGETCEYNPNKKISIIEILIQDVGTSIDALTIGFINVDLSIVDAMITFSIIGIVTFIFSLISLFLGKKIGDKIEKVAPIISGLIFIGLAIKFLVQALS